jgi:hypothetical protein
MASSYTTSLKIQQIGNGEQSGVWGTTTNANWNLIEQAVSGVQTITMSNADYTLSNLNGLSDEARNMVLIIQGSNSAIRKIIAPLNQSKMYVISNQTSGGYAIIIGASTGSYITIPNGVTAQVYTDGSNFYSAQTGSAGDFVVNGNLTAAGVTDTGALSAASLVVSGNETIGGTLTLNGSVSGSVIISAPATAGSTTVSFPATTAAGTVMVSSNMPAFSASLSSGQNISNSTDTVVLYDTKTFDTATAYNTATGRFTPQVAGYYQINVNIQLSGSSITLASSIIRKNGNTAAFVGTSAFSFYSTPYRFSGSTLIYCNGSSDYIDTTAYVSATSGHNVVAGSVFSGYLVRAA